MGDEHLEPPGMNVSSTADNILLAPPPERSELASDKPIVDRARLSRVANAHYDFVWRTLRRLGLPPSAADDATQQVFLVAARRLDDVEEGAEKSFLYRSAVLIAMDARRKHGKARERGDELAVAQAADAQPSPEEAASRKQARALLDEALRELDDDLREVFVLFELEAMQMSEIAELLGIPQGTCASRLRRAREQFKTIAKRLQGTRSTPGRSS